MSRVLVPLARGFEEIEAVVKGANGITIQTDMQVRDISVDTLDMIILPGGWDGTYALADDEHVQGILKEMNEKGKNIAAICAAPFALHKAGVLKHNYTCYPSAQEQIREDGYMGEKSMVVEDANVMTSRGPGTAICFALAIVKKIKGEETYRTLRAGVLADFCEEL